MNKTRSILLKAAAGGLLALSLSAPSYAATDAEALKCGVAKNKVEESLLKELGKAGTKLCKSPGDATAVVAKIVSKLNKKITSFNEKYDDAVCDPDLADNIPIPSLDAAFVTNSLEQGVYGGHGGVAPPDWECNNVFDDP